MGVGVVEMGWEDGKLQNDIKLLWIEKSRDQLFSSEKGDISAFVIKQRC